MMAQNSTLIIREWNGRTIRQRKEDEYWSATDICQSCGKKFGHWNELKSTKKDGSLRATRIYPVDERRLAGF